MTIGVHGTVADGFEGVREKFASMLARKRADPGAQLVVYRHGAGWSTCGAETGSTGTP